MRKMRFIKPGLVLLLITPYAVLMQPQSQPPVSVSGPIPVNSRSQIFGAEDVAGGPQGIGLAAHGYVEEEYFISGTANIYQYNEAWERQIKQTAVPFTTRVIIRYPKDVKAFSGNLQMECEHPESAMSLSWGAIKRYVVEHGDAYASVMCGADLFTRKTPANAQPTGAPFVLRWFDPDRYRPLNWPQDDGIRYDLLAETAALLRSDAKDNPLAAYHVQRVYLSGWSFTGSLIRTYINAGFANQYRAAAGGPLFDGYLIGISASSVGAGLDPLNNDDRTPPKNNPHRVTRSLDVPVIELLSENEAVSNDGIQEPDSDNPDSRHRLYEVPGLSHGDGLGSHAGQEFQLASHGYKVLRRRHVPWNKAMCPWARWQALHSSTSIAGFVWAWPRPGQSGRGLTLQRKLASRTRSATRRAG